jgi:hypothetical protein
MPIDTDRFISGDLSGLTIDELGVFCRLIAVQWQLGELPKDLGECAQICAIGESILRSHWKRLAPYFVMDGGFMFEPLLKERWDRKQSLSAVRSSAGASGGRPKGSTKKANALSKTPKKQMLSQPKANAFNPPLNNPPNSIYTSTLNDTSCASIVAAEKQLLFAEADLPATSIKQNEHKPNHAADPVMRVLWQWHQCMGYRDITSADLTPHLRSGSGMQNLIDTYGEDEAVKMLVFASSHWENGANPNSVFRQSEGIRKQMSKSTPRDLYGDMSIADLAQVNR